MTADVVVVGGGPAGLTAALFSARQGCKTIVITEDIGGQAATTGLVENYPGVVTSDGLELLTTFQKQAETAGVQVMINSVTKIEHEAEQFRITTSTEILSATAVIIAHGLSRKKLHVPGEDVFLHRGVYTFPAQESLLVKGKNVAVVGGGNSALDTALLLARLCPQVTLITNHGEFRGERVLIERALATPNISRITSAETTAILGDTHVTGLQYKKDGSEQTLDVSGVFVHIGFTVDSTLVDELTERDSKQQIIVNPEDMSTSLPGFFAAGDISDTDYKQIVISAGAGAKAGMSAAAYCAQLKGLPSRGSVDWGITVPFHHQVS